MYHHYYICIFIIKVFGFTIMINTVFKVYKYRVAFLLHTVQFKPVRACSAVIFSRWKGPCFAAIVMCMVRGGNKYIVYSMLMAFWDYEPFTKRTYSFLQYFLLEWTHLLFNLIGHGCLLMFVASLQFFYPLWRMNVQSTDMHNRSLSYLHILLMQHLDSLQTLGLCCSLLLKKLLLLLEKVL